MDKKIKKFMAKKKINNFEEAKKRLLYITRKLKGFWENEKKPTMPELAIALDVFVDVVNIAEVFANEKEQKDVVKQIRSFFIPEEELAVVILLVLREPIEDNPARLKPAVRQIIEKYAGHEAVAEREKELRNDLKRIEAILLQ